MDDVFDDAWQLPVSSDDETEVADGPVVGLVPASQAARHVPRLPARPGRVAVPDGRAFVPFRCERSEWPKMFHSVTAGGQKCFLRLSVTHGTAHNTFRAVCAFRHICSWTLSARRARPLGALWAWLDHGAVAATKERHKAYTPDFGVRELARGQLEALPGAADFVEAEFGGARGGEPA